jgi:hypothetical protein
MNRISGAVPSQWLIGTWRSDRDRTIQEWGPSPPGSKRFQELLRRDLGRLTVRYTERRTISLVDGRGSWTTYRVAWESSAAAFIVYGAKRRESGVLVHFVSPTQYWVHAGRYVEYFAKLEAAA